MKTGVVNLVKKLDQFQEYWQPRVVAEINDYQFKLAKLRGEFIWHCHEETDEAFLIIKGRLTIEMRDREVHLSAGELFVVPRGVEHRPVAEEDCQVMIIEPRNVVNTGTITNELTVENDVWI